MRITWRGLELPTRVERDTRVSSDKYGRFFIEPFERGFGTTIGNSLRRVLLSSLEGSAVTSIKAAGINHEFTSIEGITEDVTDIVLNVKNLVVRLQGQGPKTMKVSAKKAGVITAAIWTNGTITPEMALVEAAKILRKHINPFVQYFELGEETVAEQITEEEVTEEEIDEELIEKLKTPVQELELSVRANNCLEAVKVETVGQLVQMTEADLLKIRSFGKTSLREIKRKLADIGLSLGMTGIDNK